MNLKEILHMKHGDLNCSYSLHGQTTKIFTASTKPVLEAAIESLFSEQLLQWPIKVFRAADLGCAAGPNTFLVISTVKATVRRKCEELGIESPDVEFYLNDLPGNDFNSLFRDLPRLDEDDDDTRFFVMGVPGSFHGRLFPRSSLHLVHSNFSVHWLSKVPPGLTTEEGLPVNKGKIYISKTSPPIVRGAYLDQFWEDFTVFLRSRSVEMLPSGRMVLILHGRITADPTPDPADVDSYPAWEQLAEAISDLVSKGQIEQEKLDSFNVPYYIASAEEVQAIVKEEGSFAVQYIETMAQEILDRNEDLRTRAEKRYKNIRAFTEPLLSHHFGDKIMDPLYDKVHTLVFDDLSKLVARKMICLVITLCRNVY
ncbi:hypothetical protein Dimus_022747 [Dionaea muscipula]